MDRPRPGLAPRQQMKTTVLASVGLLVALVVVFLVTGTPLRRTEVVWLALPLVMGVADLVLVPAVGATVRPLPQAANAEAAGRVSVAVLRNVVFLRLALADAPAMLGLVATVVTGSLLPLAIGVAFSLPLMLLFAYPSDRVVAGVRRRLEAGGAVSGLGPGVIERS